MNISNLGSYPLICFDFDGVIKDSVNVKGDIFVELFHHYPLSFKDKILSHHLANGGVNRTIKLTQYLQWAFPDTPINMLPINLYLKKFSALAVDRVIRSNWIPGMPDILYILSHNSKLFIASATPHEEINLIVRLLGIDVLFKSVWGFPYLKSFVLNHIKKQYGASSFSLIMVGDSTQDQIAAEISDVSFFLKTPQNNFPVQ